MASAPSFYLFVYLTAHLLQVPPHKLARLDASDVHRTSSRPSALARQHTTSGLLQGSLTLENGHRPHTFMPCMHSNRWRLDLRACMMYRGAKWRAAQR